MTMKSDIKSDLGIFLDLFGRHGDIYSTYHIEY